MRESRQFRQSLKKQQVKVADRDINYFIHHIDPQPNRIEQYQKILAKWTSISSGRDRQKKQANLVLSSSTKRSSNSIGSNLCQICYQQISGKRSWCRICGHECCQKCIARERIVGDEHKPVLFCEKCDREYMIAMVVKEQQQNFVLREKAFMKLAEEQQMIQSLLRIQRQKLTGSQDQGTEKNQLLQKMNMITQLSACNQILKNQIAETKKKIDWGQQIKVHLKKKLKKVKKNQSHSFTSSVHDDHDGWAPPKADDEQYVAQQNLNESIINSIIQNQTDNQQELRNGLKCTCSIF